MRDKQGDNSGSVQDSEIKNRALSTLTNTLSNTTQTSTTSIWWPFKTLQCSGTLKK